MNLFFCSIFFTDLLHLGLKVCLPLHKISGKERKVKNIEVICQPDKKNKQMVWSLLNKFLKKKEIWVRKIE